jgi:hypothetical protein
MMAARISGLALLAAFATSAAASTPVRDSPRIAPWHEIGNIGIGMSRKRVERVYGKAPQKGPPVWRYRGRGVIAVQYDRNGYVDSLSTDSPAYSTPSGIRVGTVIPRASCHRVHGTCRYHWNGFVLRHDVLGGPNGPGYEDEWVRSVPVGHGPVRIRVGLSLGVYRSPRHGTVVRSIWLLRFLRCSWGDISGTSCKPPPAEAVPGLPGLRYCDHLGGTNFFTAASPSVPCGTVSAVEAKVFSRACRHRVRCVASGFRCVSIWNGRHDRPFSETRHADCGKGALRIVINER